jgi:hypothetical protein
MRGYAVEGGKWLERMLNATQASSDQVKPGKSAFQAWMQEVDSERRGLDNLLAFVSFYDPVLVGEFCGFGLVHGTSRAKIA